MKLTLLIFLCGLNAAFADDVQLRLVRYNIHLRRVTNYWAVTKWQPTALHQLVREPALDIREFSNPTFANSQNGGADFRLWVTPPEIYVRRVTVKRETGVAFGPSPTP